MLVTLKKFACLFALLFIPNLLLGYQYNLSIGTMFQNEARWLPEWIEYHLLLGVDHFYLYDNDSTDNYQEILQPYIDTGIVDLISWSKKNSPWTPIGPPYWVGYQLSAFNDCKLRALGQSRWLAIMDVDEFILPLKSIEDFHNTLSELSLRNDFGALSIPWISFGNSYFWDLSDDKLMIEQLTLRCAEDFPNAEKMIYKTEAVATCSIHDGALHPGYVKEKATNLRLNHYQFRGSKDSLFKRRGINIATENELLLSLNSEQFHWVSQGIEKVFNVVEDRIIFKYIPALKEKTCSK